jgi:two-component system sensor histidine kinase NreB
MKNKRLPKKMILGGIAALITISGILLLAYLDHSSFEKTMASQTQRHLLMIAKATAARLEEYVVEHSTSLKVIANDPACQESIYKKTLQYISDVGFCPIENLYEIHAHEIDALTTLDADGIMLHRHPFIADRPGMDHTDKPGVAYVIREHKPCISEVFYNNLGNPAISISEPVFYKNEFAGLARWMVQLDTIYKRFLQPIKAGEKGCSCILDDSGTIVVHHAPEELCKDFMTLKRQKSPDHDWSALEHVIKKALRGEEGTGIFHCPIGGKRLIAYAPIHLRDRLWSIGIAIGYAEIAGPINTHAAKTLGLASIILFLFVVVSSAYYKSQKKKTAFEIETKYLGRIEKSAEVLQESEEKLAGIIGAVTDHMFMLDEQFNIVWANEFAKDLFGRNLVGKKCYAIARGRDKVCEQCFAKKCFEDGKSHDSEKIIIGADGNEIIFWCTASVAAWSDDDHPKSVVEVCRNITPRKRAEEELQKVYRELENKNKAMSKLSKKLLQLQEWDRQQLSMELHDQIGQTLTTIKMDTELVSHSISPSDLELKNKITYIANELAQAIREVKNICHRLRPSTLDNIGLLPSLTILIEEIEERGDLEIQFYTKDIPPHFNPDVEIAIYRIVQEGLTNILKYADAKHIFINLVLRGSIISLSIEDDGIGFDIDDTLKKARTTGKGLGLLIMRERVDQLKGDFSIESSPGHGTHILLEIPSQS